MDVLVVSATSFEIKPSLPLLKKLSANVVVTGVGLPISVYAIAKAVQKCKPKLMIQAGIAGCFDKSFSLAEVLAVHEDYFGDIGVIENDQWHSIFDMGFATLNGRPFKNGKLKNPNKQLIKRGGLKTVSAITVNEISTNKKRINLFKDAGVVLESMEGAALHYVALMEKIPFLQIRSISNYVGERDKSKWNINEAITNLNRELMRIVDDAQ